MEQAKGTRAEIRNIYGRIAGLFLICMLPLALVMWFLVKYKIDINTLSLFFIILMPFFAFVYFTRRLLLSKKNILLYTLAADGMYEEAETAPETKNFIPWEEIRSYSEGRNDANGISYIKLKLRSVNEEIIFNSKISGSQYTSFVQALKKYLKA